MNAVAENQIMTKELWTRAEIADYLGIQIGSVHRQLHRWNIRPVSRQPGRDGVNLYRAKEIRAAQKRRPGRGNWSTPPKEDTP